MMPTYDVDLYAADALAEPYEHYRKLRELGPVVWLSAHDVHVVARDAEVRAVLEDPETYCSGQGVGLNEFINEGGRGTTLMSDGEQHRHHGHHLQGVRRGGRVGGGPGLPEPR